jgi:aryl-alcohol dehydrogenase-like predicted oxidoreductase
MKRRDFIKNTTATAALLSVFPATLSAIERDQPAGKIERRTLGKTGAKLSMLGFGALALKGSTQDHANELVRDAYEQGVNYFDVAPRYGDAQDRLGPALEPIRKDVFLACKTAERTRKEAAAELDNSLRLLRTDHLDLYQLHFVSTLAEVDTILSADGAIHAFQEARKAGKVRHLGFSAHSVEAAMALMERFDFDTIMFPINFATWYAGNFGPQVLARAQEKKMGIIAIKAMVKGPWPKGADRSAFPRCWYEPLATEEDMLMGIRFTMSHPVTAAIHPQEESTLKMALKVIRRFTPLQPQEVEDIKKRGLAQTPLFRFPREQHAAEHHYYEDFRPA